MSSSEYQITTFWVPNAGWSAKVAQGENNEILVNYKCDFHDRQEATEWAEMAARYDQSQDDLKYTYIYHVSKGNA